MTTTEITVETRRTATHAFWVSTGRWSAPDAFHVEFRPLNPKTGEPWQASRRVIQGADIQPANYTTPIAYSTLDRALQAVSWQMAKLAKTTRKGRAR